MVLQLSDTGKMGFRDILSPEQCIGLDDCAMGAVGCESLVLWRVCASGVEQLSERREINQQQQQQYSTLAVEKGSRVG